MNDVNLWPPFSMSSISNTQPYGVPTVTNNVNNFPSSMFPVYYIPTQQSQDITDFADKYRSPHISGNCFSYIYLPDII